MFFKPTNIKNLGLIRDVVNTMAKQVRREFEILVKIYRGHLDIVEVNANDETIGEGEQTEP